jgi:glycosyltransferase involved in cell wall biosynthesis
MQAYSENVFKTNFPVMGTKNELVSVCIPTYNGARFLKEALLSVNSQTYQFIEIIVSDDQSSDDTLNIVNDFAAIARFPLKIYHHKPNGIAENWNHCIQKSKGTYIKFLFQDDVLMPECIEKMVVAINENDNTALIASKRIIVVEEDTDKKYAEHWISSFGDLQKGIDGSESCVILNKNFIKTKQFLESPVNKVGEPSLFLFRKELISEIGYFQNTFPQLLDYEFCLRIMKKYNIIILNDQLVGFRLHSNQATSVNLEKQKETNRFKRMVFYTYFLNLGWKNRKQLFFDYTRLGKLLVKVKHSIVK